MKTIRKKKKPQSKIARRNAKERSRLSLYEGMPIILKANLSAFGETTIKEEKPRNTVLLTNISTHFGEEICQHVWARIEEIQNFAACARELKRGKKICFKATPYAYFSYAAGGRKISRVKYSLGDITILEVGDTTIS